MTSRLSEAEIIYADIDELIANIGMIIYFAIFIVAIKYAINYIRQHDIKSFCLLSYYIRCYNVYILFFDLTEVNIMTINIRALQAAIDRKKEIQKELDEATSEIDKLDSRIRNQKNIVAKEQNDVDRLDGNSVNRMFHTIMNNYEEKYDKEVSELESAEADYDKLLSERRFYEEKISDLTTEYNNINVTNQDLLDAKKEKLRTISEKPDIAARIKEFNRQISEINTNVIEVNEAYSIGQQAVARLDDIRKQLESAESWGLFDLMGGGMVSSMIKHDRMNRAKDEIDRLKRLLRSYENELADVDYVEHLDIHIDSFVAFTDIFLDNVFSDFSSLNTIQKTKRQIDEAFNKVYNIQQRLYDYKLELANDKQRLTREIDDLIINTETE